QTIRSAADGQILPHALILPAGVAEGDVDEFLAEQLVQPTSASATGRGRGSARAYWKKTGPKNEQLDMAVYAHAIALNSGWVGWSEERWAEEIAARARATENPDAAPFDALWGPNAPPATEQAAKPRPVQLAENPKPKRADGRSALS